MINKKLLTLVLWALPLAALSSKVLADANQDFDKLLKQHWQQAQQEKIFFRTDPDGWKPSGKRSRTDCATALPTTRRMTKNITATTEVIINVVSPI